MDDVLLLQTIERYLDGKMDAEEKAFFEQHRKNVPEIDQMVVEHAMFLHQMEDYAANNNLKHSLHLAHEKLLANGDINEGGELTTKAKVVRMWTKYRKVTAIAAVVGGAIAFMISGLVAYFAPTNKQAIQQLSIEVEKLKWNQQYQGRKISEVDSKIPKGSVVTGGGTCFVIDPKGFVVTNAHVVKGSSFAVLYNNRGDEYKAKIVFRDEQKDLAILRIEDSDFISFKSLPYSIKKTNGNLGEEIFTMGYPKNDVVVSVGYLSSRTGLNGDTLSCQLQMNANPGNSGGPVLNKNGEIIGVLNGRQTQADGVGFAIKSKNIYQVVEDLKKTDSSSQKIKLPSNNASIKGKDRPDQIAAMENYVFFVKAYNK